MRGYVQVYTGDGKGKTTAALGLALRAVGAGLRVFIAQFIKGPEYEYSEINALKNYLPMVTLKQYGRGCFITGNPTPEDLELAQAGLREIQTLMAAGAFDVLILDEANIATHFGLLKVEELVELIRQKPPNLEIVLTGRRAAPEIIAIADLVTEMREVKHYYHQGVTARLGIEH